MKLAFCRLLRARHAVVWLQWHRLTTSLSPSVMAPLLCPLCLRINSRSTAISIGLRDANVGRNGINGVRKHDKGVVLCHGARSPICLLTPQPLPKPDSDNPRAVARPLAKVGIDCRVLDPASIQVNRRARQAFGASKLVARGTGTSRLRRMQPISPSTLPLSLPLPGRPNRSANT